MGASHRIAGSWKNLFGLGLKDSGTARASWGESDFHCSVRGGLALALPAVDALGAVEHVPCMHAKPFEIAFVLYVYRIVLYIVSNVFGREE